MVLNHAREGDKSLISVKMVFTWYDCGRRVCNVAFLTAFMRVLEFQMYGKVEKLSLAQDEEHMRETCRLLFRAMHM